MKTKNIKKKIANIFLSVHTSKMQREKKILQNHLFFSLNMLQCAICSFTKSKGFNKSSRVHEFISILATDKQTKTIEGKAMETLNLHEKVDSLLESGIRLLNKAYALEKKPVEIGQGMLLYPRNFM